MNITQIAKRAERLVTDNSAGILTGIGVVGVVATAFLASRATFKAAEVIAEDLEQHEIEFPDEPYVRSNRENFEMLWKLYLPAAGVAGLTIGCVIGANRISAKRAAALAGVYALSESKHNEIENKLREKLGIKKSTEAHDEVMQDRVNATYDPSLNVHGGVEGKVLCFDTYSGRYLWSTIETVNKAVNVVNREIMVNDSATIDDFYNEIELSSVAMSDKMGWNTDELLELKWTTATSPNGGPAVHVFDFKAEPKIKPWDNRSF